MEPALPDPPKRQRRKLRKEDLAAVVSVVATAVVILQKFVTEHTLLLLPSQTMALEASVDATTVALSKLQMMLSVAEAAAMDGQELERRRGNRRSWFDGFLSSAAGDEEWRQNFRMARVVFLGLLEMLRPAIELTEEATAEATLAATLYRLAHGTSLRSAAKKFGLPGSSASRNRTFRQVCNALQERLSHLFDFPSKPQALNPIIEQFAEQGMPNCCGILACTRFPVEPPAPAPAYYDRGGSPSVAMQAVTDLSGRFLDISVGWAGALPPSQILPGTRLFSRVETSGELLHGPPVEVLPGFPLPEYIIADPGYPLLPWLLTPYTGPSLSPTQLFFNTIHGHVRSSIHKAFGMLKAHWRLLSTGALRVDDVPYIVAAACILHNFLINSGEPMPSMQEVPPPDAYTWPHSDKYAEAIRDALAVHLSAVAQMHVQLP